MKKIISALVMVGFLCGCAGKKQIVSEVPTGPVVKPIPIVVKNPGPPPKPQGLYVVRAGDTLWELSRKFYGDHFQWPFLFKSNRDLIQDPDLIYAGWNLNLDFGKSDEEVAHARDLASKTPKYKRHTKPIQPLPLDYF